MFHRGEKPQQHLPVEISEVPHTLPQKLSHGTFVSRKSTKTPYYLKTWCLLTGQVAEIACVWAFIHLHHETSGPSYILEFRTPARTLAAWLWLMERSELFSAIPEECRQQVSRQLFCEPPAVQRFLQPRCRHCAGSHSDCRKESPECSELDTDTESNTKHILNIWKSDPRQNSVILITHMITKTPHISKRCDFFLISNYWHL